MGSGSTAEIDREADYVLVAEKRRGEGALLIVVRGRGSYRGSSLHGSIIVEDNVWVILRSLIFRSICEGN